MKSIVMKSVMAEINNCEIGIVKSIVFEPVLVESRVNTGIKPIKRNCNKSLTELRVNMIWYMKFIELSVASNG